MAERLRGIEGVVFNAASDKGGLPTILNISFPFSSQSEMLLYKLDIAGVAVSGGSACASGSLHPSHVIRELSGETKHVNIRISFSKLNTVDEINQTADIIHEILNHEKV